MSSVDASHVEAFTLEQLGYEATFYEVVVVDNSTLRCEGESSLDVTSNLVGIFLAEVCIHSTLRVFYVIDGDILKSYTVGTKTTSRLVYAERHKGAVVESLELTISPVAVGLLRSEVVDDAAVVLQL
ncbi:MAG: hypothetical protein MJZ71_05570 [Bacteroidales bacterium]|nr:hypothetical protein [Bacteroidales bacterium]